MYAINIAKFVFFPQHVLSDEILFKVRCLPSHLNFISMLHSVA